MRNEYDNIKKKYNKDADKKNIFINWEAIDNLPDEMEAVFSELIFDPKNLDKHFTNVGTKNKPSWYPQTDTMYEIARLTGVSGDLEKLVEPIYEEVDYNIILMIPDGPGVQPCIRRIKTGVRVTKRSTILEPDNTKRPSSPESNEFNFFARASIAFLKEEDDTKSYTKIPSGYYAKYDTVIRRKKVLVELEKFALQQAETKAFCKTVRVLAGLPTGFKTEDLQEGKLVFVKYLKSKKYLKLEMAARLQAISTGNIPGEVKQITSDIINDDEPEVIDDPLKSTDDTIKRQTKKSPFHKYTQETGPVIDKKEELRKILKSFLDRKNPKFNLIKNTEGALSTISAVFNNFDNTDESEIQNIIDIVNGLKEDDNTGKLTEEVELF